MQFLQEPTDTLQLCALVTPMRCVGKKVCIMVTSITQSLHNHLQAKPPWLQSMQAQNGRITACGGCSMRHRLPDVCTAWSEGFIFGFMKACFFLSSWYLMTPNSTGGNELINLSGCPHHKTKGVGQQSEKLPPSSLSHKSLCSTMLSNGTRFSPSFIQTGKKN